MYLCYVKFWPYYLNVAPEIEIHQVKGQFFNLPSLNSGNACELQSQDPVRSPTRCGLLLMQPLMRCVFRDAPLHTLAVVIWVTAAFLSAWSNLVTLSSGNKAVTGYFHLSKPFSVVWVNPNRSALSEVARPACHTYSKSLKSPFLAILLLWLNLSRSTWSCLYV